MCLPGTNGATFIPVILGSDKTTVSVTTGQNDYYPLYMSNGLIHNNFRRAHRNAVSLIGFLAIPKSTCLWFFSPPHFINSMLPANRENQDSAEFRTFRRNLFHGSL